MLWGKQIRGGNDPMESLRKEDPYVQGEQLARMLCCPLAHLAESCAFAWGDRDHLNQTLLEGFGTIPHCALLYCLDPEGVQICDSVGSSGLVPGHFGRNRSGRSYMQEALPSWGFALSDAYVTASSRRPFLTALQVVCVDSRKLGLLVADFNLRDLPVPPGVYERPGHRCRTECD